MASARVAQLIDRLLGEAEEAMAAGDWATVRLRSDAVLRLEPGNRDAQAYLAAAGRPAAPVAERRHMAVMFCDLRHSTEISDGADPEDVRAVLLPYHRAVASVVESFGGHVSRYMGDGVLVYFGYPSAHEDDADRAIRAGLGILAAVRDLPELPGRRAAEVRIGVHFGLALIAEMGAGSRVERTDVVGETANIAARVQALARPSTLLVTGEVASLARHAFAMRPLGRQPLRGIARTFELFEVTGDEGQAEPGRPHRSPFVGRERELAALRAAWQRARDGDGSLVLVSGEAGVGKTRLCAEFRRLIREEPHTVIQLRGSAFHQDSALRPIVQHLARRVLQLEPDAEPVEAQRRLEQALRGFDPAIVRYQPQLAALLGLPGTGEANAEAVKKDAMIEALLAWITAIADRSPLLVLVEDAHWLDPSTMEVLQSLAASCKRRPLMLLCTSRPDLHLDADWNPQVVGLARLERSEALHLVEQLATDHDLPRRQVDSIVARAEGIPLYLEELVRLAASGASEPADAAARAAGRSTVPPALFGPIMARLDALGPLRPLAHAAAVLGREVSPAILAAVLERSDEEVDAGCRKLQDAQILHWVEPAQAYVFAHALIQDVAYESMVRSDRAAQHLAVARTLEQRFGSIVESEPETLALHYERGGQPLPAVTYLRRAARGALAHSAHREAVSLLQRALDLLRPEPGTAADELDIRIDLGPALIATRGYSSPEVEANYERAVEVSRLLEDAERSFHALNGIRRFHQVRGGPARCGPIVRELLARAASIDDVYLSGVAELAAGELAVLAGEPHAGLRHLRKAETLLGEAFEGGRAAARDSFITSLAYQGLALSFAGEQVEARTAMAAAAARARTLESPYGLVYALVLDAWVSQLSGEAHAVAPAALEANRLATEHGFAYWEVASRCLYEWAASMLADAAALARLEQGVADYLAIGARTAETWLFSLLAEARLAAGDARGAAEALVRARQTASELGERFMDARLAHLDAAAQEAMRAAVTARIGGSP